MVPCALWSLGPGQKPLLHSMYLVITHISLFKLIGYSSMKNQGTPLLTICQAQLMMYGPSAHVVYGDLKGFNKEFASMVSDTIHKIIKTCSRVLRKEILFARNSPWQIQSSKELNLFIVKSTGKVWHIVQNQGVQCHTFQSFLLYAIHS